MTPHELYVSQLNSDGTVDHFVGRVVVPDGQSATLEFAEGQRVSSCFGDSTVLNVLHVLKLEVTYPDGSSDQQSGLFVGNEVPRDQFNLVKVVGEAPNIYQIQVHSVTEQDLTQYQLAFL